MTNWELIVLPMSARTEPLLCCPDHGDGDVEVRLFYPDGNRSNIATVTMGLLRQALRFSVADAMRARRETYSGDHYFTRIDKVPLLEQLLGLGRDGSRWALSIQAPGTGRSTQVPVDEIVQVHPTAQSTWIIGGVHKVPPPLEDLWRF